MNWKRRSIKTDPFSFVDLSAEGMRSTACEPFLREPFRAKGHTNFQKRPLLSVWDRILSIGTTNARYWQHHF